MHLNPAYTTPAYTTSTIYDIVFGSLGLFIFYILSGIYDIFIFLTINGRNMSQGSWTNLSDHLEIQFCRWFDEYKCYKASVVNLKKQWMQFDHRKPWKSSKIFNNFKIQAFLKSGIYEFRHIRHDFAGPLRCRICRILLYRKMI